MRKKEKFVLYLTPKMKARLERRYQEAAAAVSPDLSRTPSTSI